ncbi:FAD-dependent oxidoreductase [uncultured Roseobacter sp.]|uniref:FAD-dependent oxidoreductase n=1 Tax=uncultured Roseobacter sp. TaxID=114847 RepID=UPI00261064AE|nr:FAD-dependent oxidoreductase [uncultured Roseobacter sp.]
MDSQNFNSDATETIVIGAGPSGLSAALELQRGGHTPLLLEQGQEVGGMMRSPRWQDFTLDLGRKELYARFPEIDALWRNAVGDDYAEYPHRVGSLYKGRIVEMSGKYHGPMRAMPLGWLTLGGIDLLRGWVTSAFRSPKTYEDFWQFRVGQTFARILAQGYWEKFRGVRWSDLPPPDDNPVGQARGTGLMATAKNAIAMASRGGVSRQVAWRHPKAGTGQLFEQLADEYSALGGRTVFGANVTDLQPETCGSVKVTYAVDGKTTVQTARQVVSSMPIEQLWNRLPERKTASINMPKPGAEADRSVLLVYLFLGVPHQFPHAWLEVNDPGLQCGRITNFGAFGGRMVPDGKAAYCVEFFCSGQADILGYTEEEQVKLAVSELETAGILNPRDLIGSQVLHFPRTNAAASWREQQTAYRTALFGEVSKLKSIYHVNRPGADWASLSGIQAARAILNEDRASFDDAADPTRRQEDSIPQNARSKV